MKRWCSLLLILALVVCCVFGLAAPVRVFAEESVTWLYNGVELPALPSYDSLDYPYVMIIYDGSDYVLVLSTVSFFKGKLGHLYGSVSSGSCRRYNYSDGSWVFYSNYIIDSSYVFSKTWSPVWANFNVLDYNSSVVLSASEPVIPEIPLIPSYLTSFEGQSISIDFGDSAIFYIMVGNINGTPSCEWYINDHLYEEVFDFTTVVDDEYPYIQAWSFTPSTAGTYTLYATIKNTLGDSSATIVTGNVVVKCGVSSDDGSGSVDNSEVLGSLETIEIDIQDVQEAVAEVGEKVDVLSDQMEEVSEQLDGVNDQLEESNTKLGDIVEGITSLPEKIMNGIKGLFVPDAEAMAEQQEKWTQLLSDRFGAIYEAGDIISDIAGAFSLQDVKDTIEFPTVTIPLGEIDWTFGGWTVDVVPDGLEFLIEILKKFIDIVCTFAFVNAMKNRFDRTLEDG